MNFKRKSSLKLLFFLWRLALALFTFVLLPYVSFFFYHLAYLVDFMINYYLLRYLFFSPSTKNFCRFECRNVVCRNFIVVFLEIFLPVFCSSLHYKTPNLLNTLSPVSNEFYFIHKVSTVACTSPFQDLIFLKFCYDICFRHFLPIYICCNYFLRLQI
jgi:hypothetical protein